MIKAAKDEATKEINKIREEKEKKFQEYKEKVNIIMICFIL